MKPPMDTYIARFALVLALSALAACKKSEPSPESGVQEQASAAPSGSQAAAVARARPLNMHATRIGRWHERPERLIPAALEQLKLSDPQKAKLEALEKSVDENRDAFDAERNFRVALGENAKAGNVDSAQLQPVVERLVQAVKYKQQQTAELVNEVHATLEPPQRKELAVALRKEQEQREARRKEMGMHKTQIRAEERDKLQAERLKRELHLNDGQLKQVEAIQLKWGDSQLNPDVDAIREENLKNFGELLAGFESDTFDARKLPFFSKAADSVRKRSEREIERLKLLMPILTSEQRTAFAQFAMQGFGAPRSPRSPTASVASARPGH